MIEFSDDIKELLNERYPDIDLENMSLCELQQLREEIVDLRHEYSLIELGFKTLGNAAYGASANQYFYFYNVNLAADITGECRNLTKTMWKNLEDWFHEGIWERKDVQEQFGFELDETKHDWYRDQPVSVYSDTDSTFSKCLLLINRNNKNVQITIEDLFNESLKQNGIKDITNNGHEIVKCNDDVLNWTEKNGLNFVPIKWIMRHKVSKPMFKITTKSGKTITVTEDHSCVIFRNGEQIVIKAKDINKETDKILSVINENETYQFEEIENIEQVEYKDDYVYDIEVDDNSHTFIGNDILVHNSVYSTYGTLFQAMTPESQAKFDTDRKRLDFILKYNKEFQDKLNNKWCHDLYDHRHAKTVHEFELETVSRAGIYLKKKKYLKGLVFSKGKYFDTPKISGTGIELIKSTSPKFCRERLPEILRTLMFELSNDNKQDFIIMFTNMMLDLRRDFYKAPIEDISQSVNIGDYNKYIVDDENILQFEKGCPVSVHAIGRYNFLAHKHNRDDLKIYSGKIKYYNINLGRSTGYFGFPAGQLPTWAPPVDKLVQWQKNVIDPINRFLEVMKIPLLNAGGSQQMSLF